LRKRFILKTKPRLVGIGLDCLEAASSHHGEGKHRRFLLWYPKYLSCGTSETLRTFQFPRIKLGFPVTLCVLFRRYCCYKIQTLIFCLCAYENKEDSALCCVEINICNVMGFVRLNRNSTFGPWPILNLLYVQAQFNVSMNFE
jgi:hypothetical protein